MRLFIVIIVISFFTINISPQENYVLKVITFNVWTGLDTDGIFKMEEYESTEIREKRFSHLIREIRNIAPDVIFLQEGNPVAILFSRHS
jgi:hypothetical protein